MKKKEATPAPEAPPKKDKFREYYEAILVAVIFASFVKIFIFQTYKIPTESMVGTLLIGDHLIVDKFGFRDPGNSLFKALFPFRDIKRGDVIVFKYPKDPRMFFVKRAIGLPGDTVSIFNKKIYINGTALDEPYTLFSDSTIYPPDPGLPDLLRLRDNRADIKVPEGYYFAMGDNRDNSNDSRFWGFVPRSSIAGRGWIIYWSYEPPIDEKTGKPRRYDPNRSMAGQAWDMISVFPTFFTNTRWQRTFQWVR